jgi:dolichol-phosphate mannosyltransferase
VTYFLIPVFNERENIPVLTQNLTHALPDPAFFVFSDDGSTDGSAQAIAECFMGLPHVLLGDGKNYGPGHAFNVGFEWILGHSQGDDDRVVTVEADNTSELELLPVMLTLSRMKYDMVLASPYAQGGGFSRTTWLRKVLSFIANMILRLIFDIKVLTLSSFYRVYRVSLLRHVKDRFGAIISEGGFICMLELLVKAISVHGQIIEVPMVLHSDKRTGKSKMKLIKTSLEYVRFLLGSKRREL